jgi:hypothetical protein
MIPEGTRFIGISPNVNLTEKKSAVLNAETQPYTLDDIRGYKVYTALVTQSGGDGEEYLNYDDVPEGPDLTVGITYSISDNSGGLDMTNIGAPNNEVGTYFVATGIRPANWGEGSLLYNTGAPVVTVLENTIGDIWFGFSNDGTYAVFSDGLFILDKTYVYIGDSNSGVNNGVLSGINKISSDQLQISTVLFDTSGVNDELNLTTIEIRVYN